jgi:hypothetical protein
MSQTNECVVHAVRLCSVCAGQKAMGGGGRHTRTTTTKDALARKPVGAGTGSRAITRCETSEYATKDVSSPPGSVALSRRQHRISS